MQSDPQLKIRLPVDVKAFVESEASRNGCSQNSEIIRALRERMSAATGVKFGDPAPAAALNETLAGASSHHRY